VNGQQLPTGTARNAASRAAALPIAPRTVRTGTINKGR